MKKFIVLFFIFFSVTLFFAHPASKIIIEYDAVKKVINVDIKHDLAKSPVQDPKKHYIKSVVLTIDGKTIEEKIFDMQNTVNDQLTTFIKMDLKKGSKVAVKTICNLGGTKSEKIIIK